ncbi:hypothetical protein HXX76_008859 [Chlamydomonas incerta]|uniref:Uncharacterized protein n=1 Tax=Chlamydomonas incerta TaxID=51695 RepID=A0A835SYR8_CHLIN|nr:hypothetical protein HXX76_008858 [Chlamydomonas incerta]KAG2432514.1 hypothetical protein HXX76_008859 [Chlamydomonas incerta]|eukprot:KAG2432513.1 hypothetical protein HXX76_008858 [Chlamydomonas incerta]
MARRSSAAAAVAVLAMALCLMGAAQARKASIYRSANGRMLLGGPSVTCPTQPSTECSNFYANCAKITCSNLVVTVDVSGSGCKGGTYSWGACLKWGVGDTRCGTMTSCTGANKVDYCDTFSKVSFQIDVTDTKVGIQIHDGSFTTGSNTDCLVENTVGDFSKPLTAQNFLTTYNCLAKPNGVFSAVNPITGQTQDFTLYPPMITTTYAGLNNYFAAATSTGAAVAVACYTDTSYTTVSNYLYVSRIDTAADNYKCLTCKWFAVYSVTPGACKCSTDTAWAIPPKAMMEALPVATGEQALSGALSGVYWNARADASKANAWGGYFRIVPPHDTSVIYEFDVCAGCGQNRVSKGFIMGRIQFAISNTNGKTSVTTFAAPSLTASTTSSVLHMYQSFIAPPSLTPGQFSKFTGVVGPATTPFTYGASWSSTVLTGTIKSGSSTYSVPSTESGSGLYLAIHLTVGGSMCF